MKYVEEGLIKLLLPERQALLGNLMYELATYYVLLVKPTTLGGNGIKN